MSDQRLAHLPALGATTVGSPCHTRPFLNVLSQTHVPNRSSLATSFPLVRLGDPRRSELFVPFVESRVIREGAVTAALRSSVTRAPGHRSGRDQEFGYRAALKGRAWKAVMGCPVQTRASQVGGFTYSLMSAKEVPFELHPVPVRPQANRQALCKARIAQEHDWRSLLRSLCPPLGALLYPSYQKGWGQFNPSKRNRGMKRERSFDLDLWAGGYPRAKKERS